jgi:hypothetical protein
MRRANGERWADLCLASRAKARRVLVVVSMRDHGGIAATNNAVNFESWMVPL